MGSDQNDDPRAAAIDRLTDFGLSTYAARTFVALTELESGTARDVSEVADVPRTRVYDAVEELRDRGLVTVQDSAPKQFHAIPAEAVGRKFERDVHRRTAALTTALSELEPAASPDGQLIIGTEQGSGPIEDRVVKMIEAADTDVRYLTEEQLLGEAIIEALIEAAERGVAITLGGFSQPVQTQLSETIPSATIVGPPAMWSETPAGRLLMVDESQTLASIRRGGEDPRAETAIWGDGESNTLVVVLHLMLEVLLETEQAD